MPVWEQVVTLLVVGMFLFPADNVYIGKSRERQRFIHVLLVMGVLWVVAAFWRYG